jgi:hypothetical protein
MLIAALAVGLIGWYYFGQKVATWAAGATAGLLLAAAIVPGLKWPAYGVLTVGVVALCMIGARRPPESRTTAHKAVFFARQGMDWVRKRFGL